MSEQEKQLQELAQSYADNKAKLDRLKKQVESDNASIKQLMELLGKEDVELDDGRRIVYGVTVKESLDEEKLITQLKHFAPDTQCIMKKEYVDMDVLENEIYKGLLSDDALVAMESCKVVKNVPTLNIRKAKKK